jgi:hypothetical protein
MLTPAIRQKIEARFGQSIRYSKDCEALARSINKVCPQQVSTTTLKRLFGFAHGVAQPRRFTLDSMAIYIGYPNWESLLHSADNEGNNALAAPVAYRQHDAVAQDIYQLHQQLSITQATQSIDVARVEALAAEFGRHPAFIPFVTELISIAGRLGHTAFLERVYSLPGLFDSGTHDPVQLYYIGQAMGLLLRNHDALADALIRPLAAKPNAQRYFVEWFVDEDYLGGYYGRLLDAYHIHKQEQLEDRLFYFALKYRQSQLASDMTGRNNWYRQIKALPLRENIYSILAARYMGICLAEEPDYVYDTASPFYAVIMRFFHATRYDEAVNFLVFLCRELFRGKRPDWLLPLVTTFSQLQRSRASNEIMHWTRNLHNELLIYKAYAAHLQGENTTAQNLLDQIDPHLFDVFRYRLMQEDLAEVRELVNENSG